MSNLTDGEPGASQAPSLGLKAPKISLVSFHPKVVAAHRRGSLLMSLPAILGVIAAPFYIRAYGVDALDVGLFLGMYVITLGFGLSVGYHRHFTHGAFRAPKWLRWLMAVCGSMGGQGSLTYWVAVHRRHHKFEDAEGDPHSPNLSGKGLWNRLRGFWHGHFGWTLNYGLPNAAHYAPDLLKEPYLMSVNKHYRLWVLSGLFIPAIIGGLVRGTWPGVFGGLLWGGCLRSFVAFNSIWSLNSFCHLFGSRDFETNDQSTNNAWLAIPTMGESWHNNHHAHPTSAIHGMRWWQLDLNYRIIWLMEKLGLATQVNRPAEKP